MALGATLFALMNFFARLASSSASWASVGAVRAFVGALVAIAVARARGAPLAVKDKRAIFWRSLLGTGAMVATFYALSSRTLSLGDTATLLYLTPVFLAILAPIFLRERTSFGVGLAIAISLAGVMLVLRPAFLFGARAPAPGTLLGLFVETGPSAHTTALIALLAAFLSSIAMMLLRKMGQSEGAEAIALHFSIFATLTMLVFSLFDPRIPTARDAMFMALAGVCAGVAQIAMTRAYALEDAARVGGIGYLSVVVSALLGAFALHERPGALAIAGMLLVIGGGLLASFSRRSAS
jgi:drug/metabolite transporter (DMT)-like permease